ncbi:MAG: hypothetical protein V4724_39860 [Pseudomonadota bacterium]
MTLYSSYLSVTAMNPDYTPNTLLDALLKHLNLKSDAELSRALEIDSPIISKVRHYRIPISSAVIIRMHEVTGMSIKELKSLLGNRRMKWRMSNAQGRPKHLSVRRAQTVL